MVDAAPVSRSLIASRRAIGLLVDVLERTHLLWRLNFSIRGDIGGRPVVVPLIKGEGIQLVRGAEPWMVALLRRLMWRHDGALVDVGANLGQTLVKVKAVDPERPYYGFEPNPAACQYCRELVRVNQYDRATIFPIGLSRASGVVTLFSSADTDPSASLVEGFRRADRYAAAQPVSVHKGDEVLASAGVKKVGIVKIDVEGAELDVLTGLIATLRRDRPVVLCEVLPVYDVRTPEGRLRRRRQHALTDVLRRLGYGIQRIDARGDLTDVEEFGIHSNIEFSNYQFAPRERYGSSVSRMFRNASVPA
jgi:FkbM family methyltransferase